MKQLSTRRKRLLRKNLGKIYATFKYETIERTGRVRDNTCRYQYTNGCLCVVGACLTKDELAKVIKNDCNTKPVYDVVEECDLDISDSDLEVLSKLQESHDEACFRPKKYGKELYESFKSELEQAIKLK